MSIDLNATREQAQAYARAWSSGDPAQVTGHFTKDGTVVVNRGAPTRGRVGIEGVTRGFQSTFPDFVARCDGFRLFSAGHGVFTWTLAGHHAETGNHVQIGGWDEWDLGPELPILHSEGWFDADDYAAQVAGSH